MWSLPLEKYLDRKFDVSARFGAGAYPIQATNSIEFGYDDMIGTGVLISP